MRSARSSGIASRRGEARVVVGNAVGGVRAGQRSGAHHRRRGAGFVLQAGRDAALSRARRGGDAGEDGGRGRRAGLGHALAGVLLQREEKQVCAGRVARPGGAASAAGSRDCRHAAGVSGDRAGAGDLAQAGGGNSRAAGEKRAGHGAAQPARIFSGGACAAPAARRCSARTAPSP